MLNTVASILGLDPIDLQKSLTMRVTTARNESISTPLTLEKALETRDALARGIYGGLFRWIVEQTNARIASGSANKGSAVPSSQPVGSIGVLDIFGFENFPVTRPFQRQFHLFIPFFFPHPLRQTRLSSFASTMPTNSCNSTSTSLSLSTSSKSTSARALSGPRSNLWTTSSA